MLEEEVGKLNRQVIRLQEEVAEAKKLVIKAQRAYPLPPANSLADIIRK
jgi:hypothetical protein